MEAICASEHGILRGLLARGAIGLITTHDLALTVIADELAPRAANIHFEDGFEGGEIKFDFRAKAGPVTLVPSTAAIATAAAPHLAREARVSGGRLGTPVQLVPEQVRFLRALAGLL